MTVLALVRRARRRFVVNEALRQAALALTLALALIALLLILGTQILAWHWLISIPLAALCIGTYRLLRRVPGDYAIAQRIDGNLKLSDTLSTAVYYAHPTRPPVGSETMRESQRAVAERAAEHIPLDQALPFHMPRAVYSVAFFGVLATGLFGLRYGFLGSLDLKPPLTSVIQEAMGWEWPAQLASAKKQPVRPKAPQAEDAFGMNLPDSEKSPGELDPAGDEALDTVSVPEADPEKYGGEQVKGSQGQAEGKDGEQDSSEQADAAGSEGAGDGEQSDAQGKQPKAGQPSPSNKGGENSSLMAKLKEAMQNLMSRMKQQNQSGQQQASTSPNGQQQGKQQSKSGQKGGNQASQQKGEGQESEGSEDGQAGDDAQMAQNPQGKGSGQSPDDSGSKQPGSGVGKQDGNKDAKLAEQLAAMGKISEIIGKRSASVSGEITIEVQNTSQQLRTPYAASAASHAQTTGEIARDEVPLMYQSFVQQYFEHVRKQETASVKTPGSPVKPGPRSRIDTPGTAQEPASSPVDAARRPMPSSRTAGQ